MRKVGYLAVLGLMALPLTQDAQAADDGKVYYKDGSILEFPEFKMKLNAQFQILYAYNEFEDSEVRKEEDTSGFDVKRARFVASGDALGGDWSYKLENDFSSKDGGSEMKDAWLQMNLDDAAKVRAGQFKEPFSRQEVASDFKLQFVDRSLVSDTFTIGRDQGAMMHGALGESLGYSLAVFNGESEGEGVNKNPVDNNLKGVAQLVGYLGDYGERDYEGDHRDGGDFAATYGVSGAYGEGEVVGVDFDKVSLNADIGIRVQGASLQSEYYYETTDVEASESVDKNGFYVQGGVVTGSWEPVARFGWIDPDRELGVDEVTEYSVGLNHFFSGHALKATVQVTFEDTDLVDNTKYTDTRAEVQISAIL